MTLKSGAVLLRHRAKVKCGVKGPITKTVIMTLHHVTTQIRTTSKQLLNRTAGENGPLKSRILMERARTLLNIRKISLPYNPRTWQEVKEEINLMSPVNTGTATRIYLTYIQNLRAIKLIHPTPYHTTTHLKYYKKVRTTTRRTPQKIYQLSIIATR